MKLGAFAVSAALGLAAVSPAAAADQLARSLNVTPGAHTATDLVALKSAIEDRDRLEIRRILDSDGSAVDVAREATAPVTAGSEQLARSVGVAPGALSDAELAALKNALEDNDRFEARQITNRALSGGATTVAPNAQLARSLGVEPGRLSAAQLVALKAARDDDDRFRAEQILNAAR